MTKRPRPSLGEDFLEVRCYVDDFEFILDSIEIGIG